MNFYNIKHNLAEAAEELVSLQAKAASGTLNEGQFQVCLLHAYHHLNWAWNTRHTTQAENLGLTQELFEKWGKYPADIEED